MRLALALLATISLAAVIGCGEREVTVVSPDTSIHLSGRWNDDDSKSVSSEMIDSVLRESWVTDFRDRMGRKPTVRVSQVTNKSGEDIATGIFTNDLERALIGSGRVSVVASRSEAEIQRDERTDIQNNAKADTAPKSHEEKAADYLLQGAINIQHDPGASKQVKFYQVDFKLIDTTSNEVVWVGSTERKKTVVD